MDSQCESRTTGVLQQRLSRLILGAQTSLIIGVLANGIAVLLGATVGITAGYFGGWIGGILMRFTDLMMAFPALLLAIVLLALAFNLLGDALRDTLDPRLKGRH